MNDNKKKILTDEELQEVSGGIYEVGDIGSYVGSDNDGTGAWKTSSNPFNCTSLTTKESCEKKTLCKWSSDGTCKNGVSLVHFI
jgi:bacteriocin-like protein